MKVKEESEKADLKLNIQKTKIRVSGPITWEWKQWQTLFSWALKSLQRWLKPWNWETFAPWKKIYDQHRQHIKKQRHNFSDKDLSSKSYCFSSSHVECESWTIKKAEHQRVDAFELWCWRRLLRVPWTARRSNQSILKEISPEYSLEGLTLKLKLQYFGQLMQKLTYWKRLWCSERLKAGGEGDDRGWDGWMAPLTQWTWVWADSGRDSDGQGSLACCSKWGRKKSDMTEWLNNKQQQCKYLLVMQEKIYAEFSWYIWPWCQLRLSSTKRDRKKYKLSAL